MMASVLSKIGAVSPAPNPEPDIDPGCVGKVGYSSPAEAKRALAFLTKPTRGVNLYQCKSCRHWHIGSRMAARW